MPKENNNNDQKISRKGKVLLELFNWCEKNNIYSFDNSLVKDISKKYLFGNPFDATKIDKKSIIPKTIIEKDYALIHLGNGKHKFIKGLDKVFHDFEPIQNEIEWTYKKSLLNKYNTSESNILSIANNQRILHHFLFGKDTEFNNIDILKRPKTYFPHRTKANLEYYFGDEKISLEKIQIEIDLTIELEGTIGIFEAKNGKPDNFNVYQLYHPFLYYYYAKQEPYLTNKIKEIICVYLVRLSKNNIDNLKLWSYTFSNPKDITSIKFIKSTSYRLIQEEF